MSNQDKAMYSAAILVASKVLDAGISKEEMMEWVKNNFESIKNSIESAAKEI